MRLSLVGANLFYSSHFSPILYGLDSSSVSKCTSLSSMFFRYCWKSSSPGLNVGRSFQDSAWSIWYLPGSCLS